MARPKLEKNINPNSPEAYHPGTHWNGQKTPSIVKKETEMITKISEMYEQGLDKTQVLMAIKEEYPTTYIGPRGYTMKEGYKQYVMAHEIKGKEFYVKESLIKYEEIDDESHTIRDRKEGLKIQLAATKDRNELLGLTKGGVTVEINFDSKNFSDADFLNNMNAPIDITPVEEEVPVAEVPEVAEVEVEEGIDESTELESCAETNPDEQE